MSLSKYIDINKTKTKYNYTVRQKKLHPYYYCNNYYEVWHTDTLVNLQQKYNKIDMTTSPDGCSHLTLWNET